MYPSKNHPKRLLQLSCAVVTLSLGLAACGAAAPAASTAVPAAPTAASAGNTSAPAASTSAPASAANVPDCDKVQSDLKIGFDNSLTGGTSDLGDGSKRGTMLAIKEYNAKGGYKGKLIGCVILDDQTKPDVGQQNVSRLINQDKVFALTGVANTGVSVPFAQRAQEAEIPFVDSVATGSAVTAQMKDKPKSYIFRVSMYDLGQVDNMLKYALDKRGFKKPAILHDVTGYGTLGRDDVKNGLAARNLPPVDIQSFQIGDTDMTPQLQKFKDAGVDVVFTYALAPELAQVLKSADKIGFKPVFVGSWTWAQPLLPKLAGEDLVKKFEIFMIQSFTPDRDAIAAAFDQKVIKETGDDPVPITAAQGYDATRLILTALDKAGPDPKAIRDALETITDFQPVTTAGTAPFTATKHEAIDPKDMFVATYQVVAGKLKLVKAQ